MGLFPIFVKLQQRLVVVIGAGEIAAQKIDGLLLAEARIRVVAPDVSAAFVKPIRDGRIEWIPRKFAAGDLDGATLAIAATSAPGVNASVFREQIAISTNGKSPALAQRLRRELEQQFGPEYEVWLEWLGAARELLRAADGGGTESNKQTLHQLASRPMFERFVKEANTEASRQGVS